MGKEKSEYTPSKLLPISTRCQFLGIIPLAFSVGLKTNREYRKLERVHEQMLGRLDVATKTHGGKSGCVFGGKDPSPVDQGFAGFNREERSFGYRKWRVYDRRVGHLGEKRIRGGPFSKTAHGGFRGNPLMAAVQKTKVRPILNLSSPTGRSFNDAVDVWQVENLQMSTPRIFADSILRAGWGPFGAKPTYKTRTN